MSKTGLYLAAAIGLVLAGCDGGSTGEGIGNDAEPMYIEGGGTGGGAIDGRVNVYVYDDEAGTPIAGAFVMLGPGPEPEFSGTTDATGLVTFRDGDIEGPQQVTVYASGFPLQSMWGLDAANLTASLETEEAGTPPVVETGTVTGTVTGFDDIDEPPQGGFKVALVSYAYPDLFSDDNPEIEQPAGEPPQNMVIPGMQESYSLLTYAGTQALYAIGGTIVPKGEGEEPDFNLTHFGVVRGLTVAKDDALTDVDIALQPMDQAVKIAVDPVPGGVDTLMVMPLLDLGDDGQVLLNFAVAETDEDVFEGHVPALAGDVADGTYVLLTRAYKETCTGSGDQEVCEEDLPASMALHRDLTPADLADRTVDDLLETPAGLTVDTNRWSFAFDWTADADAMTSDVLLVDDDDDGSEERLFSAILFDSAASGFTLPDLPAAAGFPGLPNETLTWRIGAMRVREGVDPFNMNFDRFPDNLTHMTEAEKTIVQ